MDKICSICGSKNIKIINSTANQYRCLSCDEIFNLSSENKQSINSITNKLDELSAKEIYLNNIKSIVEISCIFNEDMSCGTGFYVSKEGHILTNAHVLVNKKENKVELCDNVYLSKHKDDDFKKLEIIYMDSKNDLALLKSKELNTNPIKFSNNILSIGDKIYAIGNSKGDGLILLDGIVRDLNRDFNGHKTFLFNALVTNGCSGGPIFNSKGYLCGVIEGGSIDAVGMNYGITLDIIENLISSHLNN